MPRYKTRIILNAGCDLINFSPNFIVTLNAIFYGIFLTLIVTEEACGFCPPPQKKKEETLNEGLQCEKLFLKKQALKTLGSLRTLPFKNFELSPSTLVNAFVLTHPSSQRT